MALAAEESRGGGERRASGAMGGHRASELREGPGGAAIRGGLGRASLAGEARGGLGGSDCTGDDRTVQIVRRAEPPREGVRVTPKFFFPQSFFLVVEIAVKIKQ